MNKSLWQAIQLLMILSGILPGILIFIITTMIQIDINMKAFRIGFIIKMPLIKQARSHSYMQLISKETGNGANSTIIILKPIGGITFMSTTSQYLEKNIKDMQLKQSQDAKLMQMIIWWL